VVRAKRHFQRAVSTLRELYAITHLSDDAIKRERAFQQSDWNRRMYNIHSEEQLAELLAAPLSDFVLNPAPDPVDLTPLEEFVPIHSFLRSGQPLPRTPDGNVTFSKGTICQDGRLDLCKQVVGPRGVDDLMKSLELDARQQRMIQHLLLGNNICGNELALKAAELIRKGASALTTYYIAGNCMTGDGIGPLCDALATEKLVKQLWLKRNPLRATGACHMARMLTTNTTLQVLDLATTGLLNEGFQALLSGLRQNASLRHLYLAGNGIDTSGLTGVSEYLEHQCQLETLSVGCNRLGDTGAIIFAEGLRRNSTLKRFEMASCGIGSKGGAALADMLTVNTTLLHLDIGCLTMTVALKEVPNRIGVQGAKAFADALRLNSTMRSLVLFHNGIYQEGVDALRAVLCDEERGNTSLVHLELEQLGVPHNEMSREDIRYALKRNYLALTDAERTEAEEAVDPRHHREIISVYRMNGTYKGTTVLSSTIASALDPNNTASK
jgi:Ran GTPase-activating protein (RanGAP) involved in mRNA processing and transport